MSVWLFRSLLQRTALSEPGIGRNLIENAYLPSWRYAVDNIMENYTSGDSWLHAVRKTERQYWSVVNRTAPTEK